MQLHPKDFILTPGIEMRETETFDSLKANWESRMSTEIREARPKASTDRESVGQ